MGIADSIISAFLSHQFAKERQEQAQAAQEKQQKEQSQARLQQALMMKDIMGQQQEQRLQEQIAARKAQQEDAQAFRKAEAEKYKLTAEMTLKHKALANKQALDEWTAKAKHMKDLQLGLFQAEQGVKAKEKEAAPPDPKLVSDMFKVDPNTLSLIPIDDPAKPTRQLLAEGFRYMPTRVRENMQEIKRPLFAFKQLQNSWEAVKEQPLGLRALGKGPFGTYINPEAAVFEKDATNFTSLFDALIGGVRGGASPMLYNIRRRVLPDLTSNPEVGSIVMKQMGELMDLMVYDQMNVQIGFRDSGREKKLQGLATSIVQDYDKFKSQSAPATRQRGRGRRQLLPGVSVE